MSDPPDPTPSPAELLNIPVAFTHGDKTYKSRQLDLGEIGEFCAWLEQQAVTRSWFSSKELPDEARMAVMDSVNRQVGVGAFRVGGIGYLQALTQPECGAYLLYLGLRNEHPDLTQDDCTTMFLAEYERRAKDALRSLGHPNASGGRKGSSGPSKASSPSARKKASRRRKRKS